MQMLTLQWMKKMMGPDMKENAEQQDEQSADGYNLRGDIAEGARTACG